MNRGMAVPISFKLLTHPADHTEENMRLANILGWCIELVSLSQVRAVQGRVFSGAEPDIGGG